MLTQIIATHKHQHKQTNFFTMAASSSSSSSSSSNDAPAPSPFVIVFLYILLGASISFLSGPPPPVVVVGGGTRPEIAPLEQIAPTLIVVCAFLVSYSVWDVMAVGLAKQKYKYYEGKSYKDLPLKVPEEVYLAQRVQTNQLEQMPVFLVGSLSCALFVNGTLAAIMSLIWVILRRRYASVYRGAVGVASLSDIGLSKLTIPAYFMVNGMVMATAVHAVRSLLA